MMLVGVMFMFFEFFEDEESVVKFQIFIFVMVDVFKDVVMVQDDEKIINVFEVFQ